MKLFDKCYYTLDFDQSVLDFIRDKYPEHSTISSYEWCAGHSALYYGTGVNGFWTDNDDNYNSYKELSGIEFKKLIGMSVQEQYTQSELSYINQLEDRVELLESLCHDYAEQIHQLNHKLIAQAANIVVGVDREGVQHKPVDVFKPIKDYTKEDWELALEQDGVFLDNTDKELTLEKVWKDGDVCFFESNWVYRGNGKCTGDGTYITERIK